jgi:HSP20 family protein
VAEKLKKGEGPTISVHAGKRHTSEFPNFREDNLSWEPPVDIYETDDSFVVNAELPGIESKDVRIEIFESVLSISGERRFEAACSRESYHRLEGTRGRFHRIFALPESLNNTETRAQLKDGVLQVIIPKSPRLPRRPNSSQTAKSGTGA